MKMLKWNLKIWIAVVAVLNAAVKGHQLYEWGQDICCDGTVHKGLQETIMGCCGPNNPFNFKTQLCCGSVVRDKGPNDTTTGCCRSIDGSKEQFYDYGSQVCCNGNILDIEGGELKNVEGIHCCGEQLMDPEIHVCCGEQLQSKQDNQQCCGKEGMYDPEKHVCCKEVRFDLKRNKLVTEYAILLFDPLRTECCGTTQLFDPETEVCCPEVNLVLPFPVGWKPSEHKDVHPTCCGNDSVITDETTEFCCGGKMQRRSTSSIWCCGDSAMYDWKQQDCCGGAVYDLEPATRRCCYETGTFYDPSKQLCCGPKGVVDVGDTQIITNMTECCFQWSNFSVDNPHSLP